MDRDSLSAVFSALSDPTRRGILEQLAQGESNVNSLAKQYDMSQPAVSKHLRVLQRAGLITRTRQGRENIVRVDPQPMDSANRWIAHYARFWKQQFDDVATYLENHQRTAENTTDEH